MQRRDPLSAISRSKSAQTRVPGSLIGLAIALILIGWSGRSLGVVPPGGGDGEDESVTVEVTNALTQQLLIGLPVTAKRRVGDQFQWIARQNTDAAGQAVFELPGLATGASFVFFTTPYNGGTAQSDDVTVAGLFHFPVGHLPVQVIAGGSEAPLVETRVTLKEKLADGSLKWISQGTTDAGGMVIFDPPGLGTGRVFMLEARSPWDNSVKRSNEITEVGGLTFVVGNAPLNVTLLDALSDEPLPDQRITAYERLADDQLKWITSRITDQVGFAVFDLDGLGDGRVYVLRVAAFNGGSTYSENLTAAGEYVFKVGTLKVTVVEGSTGEPMPATKVTAYERRLDEKLQWVSHGITDDDGVIRFDLPGLGQGKTYVLRAASPWDGSAKYSNDLTEPGEFVFPVGNAALRVTLINGLTDAVLPGVRIDARERLGDGSSRWVTHRTTDDGGVAVFDLDGLGDGRVYFLSAYAYNGGAAYSDDLEAAGDLIFKVGMLEVTVVRGSDGTPLTGISVTIRERLEDGNLKWVTRGTTDENGIVRFDPPGLGKGSTFVLEARSPYDGTTKRSDDLTQAGRHTFVVGNAPLNVRLVNGLSGDPLASVRLTAHERMEDGKLRWVTSLTTDDEGWAVFDLDGLGEGRTYVLSAVPYNGGTVYSDELREPGNYEFRVGTVEVTVVSGADGKPLSALRVTAKEKGEDGKLRWVKSGLTDEKGMIRFDLPAVGHGGVYVLEARSPADGSTKRSQEITEIGKYLFRVGNVPLIVTLRNGLTDDVLPGVSITAYERSEDRLIWSGRRTTDDSGRAIFDLDGLGGGRIYVLRCEPYNGGTAYSDDISKPGTYEFRVGTLEVTVVSGATGEVMVDATVTAREVLEDGKLKWVTRGTSDAAGIIRFDLPGLGHGREYVLEAQSPVDGSKKRSHVIAQEGRFTFVVGNKPLQVTLINGVTGAPLVGVDITAREQLPEGNTRWVARRTTDDAGVVVFDLDGLGLADLLCTTDPTPPPAGRTYVLYTQPYNAGGVYSDPITEPGAVYFRVGTVPVTLIDGDNDVPIVGKRVIAYEKLPEGNLRWITSGLTDDDGTVHFDLRGLSQLITSDPQPPPQSSGRWFVFRADRPFDDSKKYYSRLVDREGPVEFRITRDGDYPIDTTAPTVSISAPSNGAYVAATGFTVTGLADDNATVTDVTVSVDDPVVGTTTITAAYDSSTKMWTATVTAAMVTASRDVTLTATARDQSQNQASVMIVVTAVTDMAAPQITFTSHQNGDDVDKTGFVLAGTATDDVGVTSLVATLSDSALGVTIDHELLGVATDGRWTFVVLNGQVAEGSQVVVTLDAGDAIGNTTTASITLNAVSVPSEVPHLINRITFGITPDLRVEVETSGADAFLDQQLDPQSIDDTAFQTLIANVQPTTTATLQTYMVLHAVYSRRQLLEVMTAFWDNHFNTDINSHDVVDYEVAENALLRQHALGNFRDLLEVSAKSPAMLIYLDNVSSVRADPNENYARELLELHTLGVDGGYIQTDVEQVAEAFTGWTVSSGAFFFDANEHDTSEKTVLGNVLPANRGIEDGEDVLDILATHPSTASFICTKLGRLLVADTPPASLVSRCAAEFLNSGGEITPVLRVILRSPEFADPQHFRAKVKDPLEFSVGIARNLNANTDGSSLRSGIRSMGMRLFENPVPTGWSETGDDWINSNTLLQRIKHSNQIARGSLSGTNVQLVPYFSQNGQVTADGIVGFLFQLLFYNDFTQLEYQSAVDILNTPTSFDIGAADAETRLRRMVATVLSYPGYEFQ